MSSIIKPFLFLAVTVFVLNATAQTGHRKVKVTTPHGKMIILLYDETPKHRDNFIKLVKQHFFDSVLFHRVIKNFMIQGGDPTSKRALPGDTALGEGDVGYTIPAEFHMKLFHKRGALGAARDDNPEKASSGCQFYIVQGKKFTDSTLNIVETKRLKHKIPADQREVYKTIGGTPHLDQGYTVFGEVVKGMEVVDSIANEPTDKRDRPLKDMRMKVRMKKRFLIF
jgi:cyclophilin family peptidyl-prolyl cis-trans isomerase